jgi:hypothetical protein
MGAMVELVVMVVQLEQVQLQVLEQQEVLEEPVAPQQREEQFMQVV